MTIPTVTRSPPSPKSTPESGGLSTFSITRVYQPYQSVGQIKELDSKYKHIPKDRGTDAKYKSVASQLNKGLRPITRYLRSKLLFKLDDSLDRRDSKAEGHEGWYLPLVKAIQCTFHRNIGRRPPL